MYSPAFRHPDGHRHGVLRSDLHHRPHDDHGIGPQEQCQARRPRACCGPQGCGSAAPAVNTAKEQEILAAVIAAVTEDLGPSASRMQITSINKI